jgi:putative transcriptional regulator
MDKRLLKELIESISEAGRIARKEAKPSRVHLFSNKRIQELRANFKPEQIVRARKRLNMSQAKLASVIAISKATLQSWEQGRRQPRGPALVLIRVITKAPEMVVRALYASGPNPSDAHPLSPRGLSETALVNNRQS